MTSQFTDGKVTVSSVLHPYENEFLLSFFGSDFTNREPPSDMWLGFTATPEREVSWSDDHHFDYSNWGNNQPLNQPNAITGALGYLGMWFLTDVYPSYSFVC